MRPLVLDAFLASWFTATWLAFGLPHVMRDSPCVVCHATYPSRGVQKTHGFDGIYLPVCSGMDNAFSKTFGRMLGYRVHGFELLDNYLRYSWAPESFDRPGEQASCLIQVRG